MIFDERYFESRFHQAAWKEATDVDGGQIFADISALLPPAAIAEGFAIGFGPDRDTFEKVLGVTGVQELLHQEDSPLAIVKAQTGTFGSNGFYGRAIPALTELPLADAVDATQAGKWWIEKHMGMYPYVRPDRSDLLSSLQVRLVDRPTDDSQDITIVPRTPALTLSAQYRYGPEFHSDDIEMGVADFLSDNTGYYGNSSDRITLLAEFLEIEEINLLMPGAYYSLAVATPGEDEGRRVHRLVAKHGRVKPYVPWYEAEGAEA